MSDYISKSEFSEALNKSEKQPTKDSEDFIEGYCEGWNDVIDIRNSIQTISETEIICKAFERVVERLEEKKQEYLEGFRTHQENELYGIACGFGDAIKIVKEEGWIE
jgi:hypothetical protein